MYPEDLPNAPAGLVDALHAQDATVTRVTDHEPRYHVRLSSGSGPLFGWYSIDRRGPEVLRHELEVRTSLGDSGTLRAPPVTAHGANWRVERIISSVPLTGGDTLGLVVETALEIAHTALPSRPYSPRTRRETVARTRRRMDKLARVGVSPLSMRDWVLARRLLRGSPLPRVVSHGCFIPVHVLVQDGVTYVIDWEDLGRRPLGWDLMQFWAGLPDADDRHQLLELTVDALGARTRRAVMQLRYAALVERIVSKIAEDPQFGERDRAAAEQLLALVPEARDEALAPAGSR